MTVWKQIIVVFKKQYWTRSSCCFSQLSHSPVTLYLFIRITIPVEPSEWTHPCFLAVPKIVFRNELHTNNCTLLTALLTCNQISNLVLHICVLINSSGASRIVTTIWEGYKCTIHRAKFAQSNFKSCSWHWSPTRSVVLIHNSMQEKPRFFKDQARILQPSKKTSLAYIQYMF